jgi:hypothetical protein
MLRSVRLAILTLVACAWAGLSAAPASAVVECGLAGSWAENTQDVGSSTWSITADGTAEQRGLGNAKGRGDLQGDVLTITWSTADGYAGHSRWTLDASCKGKGKLTFTETADGDPRKGKSFDSTISGPAPVESDPCAGTRAHASAGNEVRIVAVHPGVQVHRAGTPPVNWVDLCKDTVLQQGDEISCDPDGSVTLQFADNSTVVVKNTTQLKIASFFTEGGVVKTEILLKMGEIAAKVHKSEATKSDFRIKNPTVGAGVRDRSVSRALARAAGDTEFSVFYDPGSKTSLWSVRAGALDVASGSGKPRVLSAGQEAFIVGSKVTVGKLGHAGERGGVTIAEARDAVLRVVAKGNGPCGIRTPRTNAYAIKTAPGGWSVAVKILGKLKGTSKWTVKGTRVTPRNALAKRIKRGCR